ncbi:MAG: tetratricopeptide repeat protein, partial [Thermoplasmata archaeon]
WEKATPPVSSLPSGTARRLAVLPLANLSADPQDEYFADGLTEEIISELSKVPGLRVIARTSVMRFRGSTKGVSEIGKELRVGTIIEGSVRRAGSRIRVTAQLIDSSTEEHRWSEKYDRELVDVFAIQSEIAKEVSAALNIALPSTPPARRRPPPNPAAFRSYLRGRYLWNRRSDEQVRAALGAFEEALRLDPQFAEASSGIADCYTILVDRGWMSASEGEPKAKAAAQRAIQLDETNGEAHASLALLLDRNYQWAEAEREYERAIELNPMYASAHQWYYMHLMTCGRKAEAAGELDRAEEADPLSPIILFHRAYFTWITGTDAEAVAAWNRATEVGGDLDFTGLYKLAFYVSKSMRAEAIDLARKLTSVGLRTYGEVTPAMIDALLGEPEKAYRELEALSAAEKGHYTPSVGKAWVYGILGDADRFFEWLFRSADERSRSPLEFVSLPIFEKMRADPRFQEYLRRCGLAG